MASLNLGGLFGMGVNRSVSSEQVNAVHDQITTATNTVWTTQTPGYVYQLSGGQSGWGNAVLGYVSASEPLITVQGNPGSVKPAELLKSAEKADDIRSRVRQFVK